MSLTVEPSHQRDWSEEQMAALFAEGFPDFITADQAVKKYIGRVRECFPHLDVMLVDEDGSPAAAGWGVPIRWSGEPGDLPESFADVLRRALEIHDSGAEPDTFVICGGVVHPDRLGTGTARDLVRALCELGVGHEMTRVIAPIRPTRKHLYPLFTIEDYASWVRGDGLPLDPWLRLHVRVGGTVVGLARQAQTMLGSVRDWEQWTGMRLPATGDYVIPHGMGLLRIDVAADVGRYVEPNVWVQHR